MLRLTTSAASSAYTSNISSKTMSSYAVACSSGCSRSRVYTRKSQQHRARRRSAALHPTAVLQPCSSSPAQPSAMSEEDAFAELVRLARQVDPSLPEPPAARQPAGSSGAAAAAVGPALPHSSKPAWLRQRAAQGERYEYLQVGAGRQRRDRRQGRGAAACAAPLCAPVSLSWPVAGAPAPGAGPAAGAEAGHCV